MGRPLPTGLCLRFFKGIIIIICSNIPCLFIYSLIIHFGHLRCWSAKWTRWSNWTTWTNWHGTWPSRTWVFILFKSIYWKNRFKTTDFNLQISSIWINYIILAQLVFIFGVGHIAASIADSVSWYSILTIFGFGPIFKKLIHFRSEHVIIGGGNTYLINPGNYGYVSEDGPVLSDKNKYLAIGIHKSIRYVEGPQGRSNKRVGLIVESKKVWPRKRRGDQIDRITSVDQINRILQ